MNGRNLDRLELPAEPKGEAVAVIKRVATENSRGEPIISKFDGRQRLLIVADANGFEITEFASLPEKGKIISGKLKRLMQAVDAKKISELEGKKVKVAKVLTSRGNQRWAIVGNGDGSTAPSSTPAHNATCLLKTVLCPTCWAKIFESAKPDYELCFRCDRKMAQIVVS